MAKADVSHTTNHGCILRSVYSGRDWLQLVAAHEKVVLDTVAYPYDVLGRERTEHSTCN